MTKTIKPYRFTPLAILFLSILIPTVSAESPQKGRPHSLSFRLRSIYSDGKVSESKETVRGNQVRSEQVVKGSPFISIFRDGYVYMYNTEVNFAHRMQWSVPSSIPTLLYLNALDRVASDDLEYKRSEDVGDYPCDVYEFHEKNSDAEVTIWIWKEHRLPVKVLSRSKEGVIEMGMSEIVIDPQISDSTFEIPSGVRIVDGEHLMEIEKDDFIGSMQDLESELSNTVDTSQ